MLLLMLLLLSIVDCLWQATEPIGIAPQTIDMTATVGVIAVVVVFVIIVFVSAVKQFEKKTSIMVVVKQRGL